MTTLAKLAANRANARKSTGPTTDAGKAVVGRNAIRHGVFAVVPVIPGEDAAEWDAHRAGVVASLAPVGLLELTLAERTAGLLWRLRRLAVYEAEAVRSAVEDIRLPIPGDNPADIFLAIYTAKKEARDSRAYLATARPAADWMAGFAARPPDESVPAAVVRRVFRAAFDEVRDYTRAEDPPWVESAGFLRRLGRAEDEFAAVPWTVALVQTGFDMYAAHIKRSGAWLAERVGRELAKSVRQHARTAKEQVARVKGLRRRQRRSADWRCVAAVLPADGRDERVIRYEGHLSKCLHTTLHELERMQVGRASRPVVPPLAVDVTVDLLAGGYQMSAVRASNPPAGTAERTRSGEGRNPAGG